jgi:hypothetical protein
MVQTKIPYVGLAVGGLSHHVGDELRQLLAGSFQANMTP